VARVAQVPVLAIAELDESPVTLRQALDLRLREHFELVVLGMPRLHEPPSIPPGVAICVVDLGDLEERPEQAPASGSSCAPRSSLYIRLSIQ
jgi:hypothetical protein